MPRLILPKTKTKMKKTALAIVLSLIVIAGITYSVPDKTKLYPVIKGHGAVHDVPFATEKPDTSMKYKIIVDIGEKNEKPEEEYYPLEHVSRMYNLHVLGGVKQKNLDVAVAIWGESVTVTLNNEAYRAKYGVDNPNIKVLGEMKKAGIKIFGCGQSIMRLGIDPKSVNPDVTIALSRFTAVSTYQMKGYAFFKY